MPEVDASWLLQRLNELEEENARLRADNSDLRSRVTFFEKVSWLEQGLRGEQVIAEMLGGQITRHNARHDILITTSKVRLEVKLANLNRPVQSAPTLRWAWGHLLGADAKKDYQRLILMGVADSRFCHLYADPNAAYVIFDVPFSEVASLPDKHGVLHLTTNPLKAKTDSAVRLFQHFQVTQAQLIKRYRAAD